MRTLRTGEVREEEGGGTATGTTAVVAIQPISRTGQVTRQCWERYTRGSLQAMITRSTEREVEEEEEGEEGGGERGAEGEGGGIDTMALNRSRVTATGRQRPRQCTAEGMRGGMTWGEGGMEEEGEVGIMVAVTSSRVSGGGLRAGGGCSDVEGGVATLKEKK